MSLLIGNTFTASDFNALKTKIYTECARRQSTNPISYTQLPNISNGGKILAD